MPTELERKARAILRDVYAKRGDWAVGNAARNGTLSVHDDETVVAAIAAALQAQQPGAQAVDLYTVDDSAQACSDGCCGGCQFRPYIPHPPSIPEPSEEDVDVACEALDFDNDVFAHMRERVQGVLATYTARLRERIGGGA